MTGLYLKTAERQSSVWTLILSSSVVLAIITGCFYLVGGARHEGYSNALGLDYLAGLQSTEYIFTGGEILLGGMIIIGPIVGTFVAVAISAAKDYRAQKGTLRRAWEWLLLALFALGPTVWGWHLANKIARVSISTMSCPATGHLSILEPWLAFFCVITVNGIAFFLFDRSARWALHGWAIVISLFCLYNIGAAEGVRQLYGPFKIAEIPNAPVFGTEETKVLVLGMDANNLVVLASDDKHNGHLEPRYVLRSDVKAMRLIGSSTINDFFCKTATGTTVQ